MKTNKKHQQNKPEYLTPVIFSVSLDCDISLNLSSLDDTPPEFGNEDLQAFVQNNGLNTLKENQC